MHKALSTNFEKNIYFFSKTVLTFSHFVYRKIVYQVLQAKKLIYEWDSAKGNPGDVGHKTRVIFHPDKMQKFRIHKIAIGLFRHNCAVIVA